MGRNSRQPSMKATTGLRPRLSIVSQWFDPEPTPKGLTFAKALQARGFDVEVVTGFPNYPGGKLYPGYRVRLWQRETIEGISVTRLPLYPSHNGNALSRSANYLSFFFSALVYLVFFCAQGRLGLCLPPTGNSRPGRRVGATGTTNANCHRHSRSMARHPQSNGYDK